VTLPEGVEPMTPDDIRGMTPAQVRAMADTQLERALQVVAEEQVATTP
jgi:hypothetical protein